MYVYVFSYAITLSVCNFHLCQDGNALSKSPGKPDLFSFKGLFILHTFFCCWYIYSVTESIVLDVTNDRNNIQGNVSSQKVSFSFMLQLLNKFHDFSLIHISMQQLCNTSLESLNTFRPLPPEPTVSFISSKNKKTCLLVLMFMKG